MKLTIFLLLRATPEWLALDRNQRRDLSTAALNAAFPDETVSFRFFDSEAFNARVSDVMVLTAEAAKDVYFTMERLRDTPMIAHRYFDLVDIIPAFENGYQVFEDALQSD